MKSTQNLNLNQLRRISLLIGLLKRTPYRNKTHILKYFEENDKGFNERTFYRLKETLARDFGIEITFDYTHQGYFFDEENSVEPQNFLSLIELLTTADLLAVTFDEKKNALSYIEFEKQPALESLDNFKIILEAIQNHVPITFLHNSFYFLKEATYTLKPYLLKQYQNRWYVIGETEKGYRNFGTDRMEAITVGTKKFKPKTQEAKDKFSHVIGLNYSDHPLEKVVLSFNISQKPYLESLPMHHTQKVLQTTNEIYVVELMIHPNFEFRQQVLKYGSLVQVTEPKWLKDEFKDELMKALKNYK
jgi:hypothetical protein